MSHFLYFNLILLQFFKMFRQILCCMWQYKIHLKVISCSRYGTFYTPHLGTYPYCFRYQHFTFEGFINLNTMLTRRVRSRMGGPTSNYATASIISWIWEISEPESVPIGVITYACEMFFIEGENLNKTPLAVVWTTPGSNL